MSTNQPRAIFNNATVRNGREVVFPAESFSSDNSINWNTTGGYVQATNTVFENNRRVVGFLPYQNLNQGSLQNNISFFQNCSFKLDEDYNFPNDPAQITAWGVDMIPILGCEFLNETPRTNDRHTGYAIQTAQASFYMEPTIQKNSVIKGFEYGIKAEMLNHPLQTISVTNTTFEENYFGAYFKNVDFHVFEGNQVFVPGKEPNFRSHRYPSYSAPYGYYNFAGTGFRLRDNYFEKTPANNSSLINVRGIVIHNSGPDLNNLANNSLNNFDIGFEGIGHNRDYVGQATPSEKGLRLQCNDFNFGKIDIYVPPVLLVGPPSFPIIKNDIASYQGNNMEPAYNLFSHATNTSIDFGNHGGLIKYFYPSPQAVPRVEPRPNFSFGIDPIDLLGENDPNFCASIEVEGFQWGTFSNAVTDYQNLVNLYTTILDQGSTSDLLNEIYLSPSSEYFELYSNLMAEPGVLSEEVVMELVHNPDFPNILIRNIVIANPHLIQSDAFWTELENRSPAFTATMLDEMWSGLANTSPIQLLLAQMGSAQQKVLAIGANGLREIGSNPATWQSNLDTVQMICNALPNPYFKFLTLLHEKTFNENLALEDSILLFLQTPAISDMEIQYFDEITTLYKHYYSAKSSPEGLAAGLTAISQEVISIMENSQYLTMRSLASSMLLKEHDDNLPNVNSATSSISHFDIVLPISGSSNKKGQRTIPSAVVAANSLRVYPNPASEFVNLEVIWAHPVGEVDIQVQSIEGRVVMQQAFKGKSTINNIPLSIGTLPKGMYIVSVTNDKGANVKQKLIVQ